MTKKITKNKSAEQVDHPDHYNQGNIECIDALQACMSVEEFIGFCRGNAIKYLWRSSDKGGKTDLEKARWYLNKLIDSVE